MGSICIRIDHVRLAARLSAPEAPVTAEQTHYWLIKHGFSYRGGSWYCDGSHMHQLQPAEVIETIRITDQDGVSFVEHEKPQPLDQR